MAHQPGWGDAGPDLDELEGDESEDPEQLGEGELGDEDLEGDEQHPWPSDEFLALADSLTQLHVANFAPVRLTEAAQLAGMAPAGRGARRPPPPADARVLPPLRRLPLAPAARPPRARADRRPAPPHAALPALPAPRRREHPPQPEGRQVRRGGAASGAWALVAGPPRRIAAASPPAAPPLRPRRS
jgi:hypothetical protein